MLKEKRDRMIMFSELKIGAHALTIICVLIETIKSVLDIKIILENLGHIVAIVIANQLKSSKSALRWYRQSI